MKWARLAAILAIGCGSLFAQNPPTAPGSNPYPFPPGQYPYPGGQMPGGQIPNPRGNKKQKKKEAQQTILAADGVTLSRDDKKLVVGTADGRILTMTVNPATKFLRGDAAIEPSVFAPRSMVHIEAAEDDEGFLTALTVKLVKDAASATSAKSAGATTPTPANPGSSANTAADGNQEMAQSTILKDSENVPDRPVLRRGKTPSAARATGDDTPPPAPRNTTGAVKPGDIDFTIDDDSQRPPPDSRSEKLIVKTIDWAATFSEGLPNFVCDQLTTRYLQRVSGADWEPLDVITAKVVYEDGKEDYREITVGGKRTNKTMMDLGGSTSTGEFASSLRSLFSSETNANFKLYQSSSIQGVAMSVYDFNVALRNSDWNIIAGGQTLRPAYSGSVWIDKSTGEVHRFEMKAEHVPQDFPFDSIQMAVDYDKVRLGTRDFFLPIRSENILCQRGTSVCTRNVIEFRDYHKFSGESTIEFK